MWHSRRRLCLWYNWLALILKSSANFMFHMEHRQSACATTKTKKNSQLRLFFGF
jgi:hypothetical protein